MLCLRTKVFASLPTPAALVYAEIKILALFPDGPWARRLHPLVLETNSKGGLAYSKGRHISEEIEEMENLKDHLLGPDPSVNQGGHGAHPAVQPLSTSIRVNRHHGSNQDNIEMKLRKLMMAMCPDPVFGLGLQ
jgi:hypothetical protein